MDKEEVVYLPTEELVPYAKNPRHNEDTVDMLCNSIREFGFKVPIIVDKDKVVICGHTRLLSAKKLGLKEVPCIIAEDLSPEKVKAFRLADNKLQEMSGWDFDVLADELSELKDMGFEMEDFAFTPLDFGFDFGPEDDDGDDGDISSEYVTETMSPDDGVKGKEKQNPRSDFVDEEPEEDDDEEIAMPTETICRRGDVIRLGRHWLLCGDALTDLDALMNGTVADIAFTSPPYNAGHLGTGRPQDGQKYLHDEDQQSDEQYAEFLEGAVDALLDHAEEVFINIGFLKESKFAIADLLRSRIHSVKDILYWVKNNPVPALAKNTVSSATELIIALGRNGSRSFRHDPGVWYRVITGNWAGNNRYSKVHRATFPLYLPTEIINRLTDEGATVLDCFGGTGTTLIACEDTGRTCYMCELEPAYCDLIVRRYIERVGMDDDVVMIRDGAEIRPAW